MQDLFMHRNLASVTDLDLIIERTSISIYSLTPLLFHCSRKSGPPTVLKKSSRETPILITKGSSFLRTGLTNTPRKSDNKPRLARNSGWEGIRVIVNRKGFDGVDRERAH